jgi:hypothetical protein
MSKQYSRPTAWNTMESAGIDTDKMDKQRAVAVAAPEATASNGGANVIGGTALAHINQPKVEAPINARDVQNLFNFFNDPRASPWHQPPQGSGDSSFAIDHLQEQASTAQNALVQVKDVQESHNIKLKKDVTKGVSEERSEVWLLEDPLPKTMNEYSIRFKERCDKIKSLYQKILEAFKLRKKSHFAQMIIDERHLEDFQAEERSYQRHQKLLCEYLADSSSILVETKLIQIAVALGKLQEHLKESLSIFKRENMRSKVSLLVCLMRPANI